MKDKTAAIALYLSIGFVVASLFISAAVSVIGSGQDEIITYTKKVENY
ncbi:hypothetical protein [Paenibacillus tepidiphilus]|nr:hypothetical protein [Paenibacillus tepidiphilus]